ncbi:MAG TPA: glucose-1-phosphate adenylyltransferase [Gemmataceae bacterium]|jgi:glucose-1-phosphate adenylyltransferase
MPDDVVSLILGGGRGTPLYPLTKHRSEPAVPIAGKYRLIDIPLSNCINSGLKRIYVLTQFLSVSLHRHIANTYKFDPFSSGFVEVLAAQQTNETADWYRGTADAIRQNLRYLRYDNAAQVLILSADQLYRMDLREFVQAHRASGAHVTIAVAPVHRHQATRLGVVRLDEDNRIVELVEKPSAAEQLDGLRAPAAWLQRRGLAGRGQDYLANMGIYVFDRSVLLDWLDAQPRAVDLVTEILGRNLPARRIQAYLFHGYWEDLGSIKSYHEANLALASPTPPFDFHSPEGIIYTRMRNLPASRIRAAHLEQCLLSDGCTLGAGTRLERCVLGVRTHLGQHVTLRDTVVNGADRIELECDRLRNRQRGLPDLGVGDNSIVERAILDKDCRIGANVRIINRRNLQQADGDNHVIREGIVVIPNGAVVPDGTVI